MRSIGCRNPLECDRAAVAAMLRTRRGGTASLASSLAFSNQMAFNSALTVRPLALNVALGLIACPLMKVHGVGANRRHPDSYLAEVGFYDREGQGSPRINASMARALVERLTALAAEQGTRIAGSSRVGLLKGIRR